MNLAYVDRNDSDFEMYYLNFLLKMKARIDAVTFEPDENEEYYKKEAENEERIEEFAGTYE